MANVKEGTGTPLTEKRNSASPPHARRSAVWVVYARVPRHLTRPTHLCECSNVLTNKRISVDVSREQHQALKLLAAATGETITFIVRRLVATELENAPKRPARSCKEDQNVR